MLEKYPECNPKDRIEQNRQAVTVTKILNSQHADTPPTYLVTGGGGFIGSHIVEVLLKRGNKVRVLDNFSTGKRENLTYLAGEAFLGIMEGDLRDPAICREAVQGVTYVLHQGALPSVPRSIVDPFTTHNVNVNGTLNLLIAARDAGVQRLVFASSSSVYGDTPALLKQEKTNPNPLSPYALSKLTGEYYCRTFSRIYTFSTVSLRYFNVFGPRQDPTSQFSAVIPRFVSALIAGKPPIIYGDGEQSRDFTYVADCVRANLLACEAPNSVSGEVFNVGCQRRTTLNELFRKIQAILGGENVLALRPEYTDPRPGDVKHSVADISGAAELLRYHPEYDMDGGLLRTVEWFRRVENV